MGRNEASSDVLQGFVKTIQDSIIEPFRQNQVKLALQRAVKEFKRYQEVETKLKDYDAIYANIRDNFMIRENVLRALRIIHANRMGQFVAGGEEVTVEDSQDIKVALAPYFTLLEPINDLRRLQTSLLTEAKLKKLPLPHEEITKTLNEIKALADRMPQILMDGVSNLSEKLEKVA